MKRPANTVDRPSADEEIVDALNGEDPVRFLYKCGSRSVTLTVRSLIGGMNDLKRVALWRKCEHRYFGGRSGVVTLLDEAESRIRGNVDDVDRSKNNAPDETAGSSAEQSVGETDDSEEEPVVRDDEYEETLERARSLVVSFDAATCRSHISDERDREEPRPHVLEALEERLAELESDSPDTDANSQTQEVSA